MLGVNEATLRQWSNEGQVRVIITPGGHRRYYPEELKRLISSRHKMPSLKEFTDQFTETTVIHQELAGSVSHQNWCRKLTVSQNQVLMALGQGMLNLMLQYLTVPSRRPETLELAHAKGEEFGVAAAHMNLSLTDSVETFTRHRSHVMHFIVHVLSQKTAHSKRTAEALALVTELMDEALVAMVTAHQHLSRTDKKQTSGV